MQTSATIILAILAMLFVGALIVAGVLWVSRRRQAAAQARRDATAAAWSETDPNGTDQQAQRPIWRPERDR